MKDKVIAAAKLKRKQSGSGQPGLSLAGLGSNIFINEHLTKKKKKRYSIRLPERKLVGLDINMYGFATVSYTLGKMKSPELLSYRRKLTLIK